MPSGRPRAGPGGRLPGAGRSRSCGWPGDACPCGAAGAPHPARCWSHVRRRFYEIAQGGNAPLAEEALARIATLYRIEGTIRGHPPEQRRTLRHDQSQPIVSGLRAWLDAQFAKVPGRSRIALALRYALKLWPGLTVFLDDGRVEIDSNVVERSIRPIATTRSLCAPLLQVSGNIASWLSGRGRHGRFVRPIAAVTRSWWRAETRIRCGAPGTTRFWRRPSLIRRRMRWLVMPSIVAASAIREPFAACLGETIGADAVHAPQ
jgi:hypothetical protein